MLKNYSPTKTISKNFGKKFYSAKQEKNISISCTFSLMVLLAFLSGSSMFAQTTTVTLTATGPNWTVPAGVSGDITVEVWGAGGSGGGASGKNKSASGGTGGTYVSKVYPNGSYTAGTTSYAYSVAGLTLGGAAGANGSAGANSWFESNTILFAPGGNAGLAAGTAVSALSTGAIGTTIVYGAGTLAAGVSNGGAGSAGANGGGAGGGTTGVPANGASIPGKPGAIVGGGGGGGATGGGTCGCVATGGRGARGEIRITYNSPPCNTPTTQPTGLSFSAITSNGLNGSFTAASPAPTNYLVVVNTTGIAPTLTNGVSYTIGSTVLGGTNVIVDNDSNTTFTSTGLTANTTYYYFVFSFNTINCTGGPLYNTTAPLTRNAATLLAYCTPSITAAIYANLNFIDTVNFIGNITNSNNSSTFNILAPFGYQNFTGLGPRASQAQGEGINIYMNTITGINANYMKAWVDWNKDGIFDTTSEVVYQCTNPFINTTFGFQVPATTTPGDYTIRIRINADIATSDNSNITPCAVLANYGETEDYIFSVVANCATKITTIAPGYTCGTGSATLGATGTPGTTEYRWYNAQSGGLLVGTTASTTWSTPSISTTTTYYVTAWNGTCESLFRTAVVATVKPIATLSFSNSTPTICGENNIIDLSAVGTTEQVHLIDENFESGMGSFINNSIASPNTAITNWQVRTSTYVPQYPTYPVWYPAISSGFGTNKFAMTTSDYAGSTTFGKVETALQSAVVNTTGFLNLTLSFRIYFSSYYDFNSASEEYVIIEYKNGAGAWTAVPGQQYLSDIGIGTQFVTKSINMNAYTNITAFQIRIRYKAGWNDGVAVDDIKLFGDKALSPNITWTSATPVDAYTNFACTIPYVAGTPFAGTLYVKPTLVQLEQANYSFTANANLANGCITSGTINVTNKSKVWKGTIDTDWNKSGNWLPAVVPDATSCVIIPTGTSSQIMNTPDALAKNLVVKAPTGNLELQSGKNLTVTDWVNVEAGATFNVRNSANLVQVTSPSANAGVITMDRTANIRRTDYVYWSSPVANFASSAISPATSTGYIYKWAPTTVTGYASNFGNWQSGNETMVNGKGYIVRGPDNYTTAFQNYTATFNGAPNNGTITTPISRGTYTGANYTGPTTTPVTKDDDNWNLVGNPYPSSISADAFLTANTANISSFVEVWTHGTAPSGAIADPFYQNYVANYTVADYIRYNRLGGTQFGYDGRIGAGQGFMVLMKEVATPNTVVFNNSMRSASYRNDQFFKTGEGNEVIEKNRIWLNLIKPNGSSSNTLVGYATGAENSLDKKFDAIANGVKTNFELYSLTENTALSIQGRALPFDNNDVIPMGVSIPQDGNYTIGIAGVDGLFANEGQNIYLEDKTLGIIHDLRNVPYSFTAETGRFENRFALRYTNNTLSNNDITALENSVVVYSNGKLNVKSNNEPIKEIVVYDLLGRMLTNNTKVNANEFTINKLNPTETTLIVKVTLENNVVVSKKVIY